MQLEGKARCHRRFASILPCCLQLEPYPELRRYNGFAAAFESGFGGWVSLITLPSIALGAASAPISALFQSQAAKLPASVVRFGPSALSAALLLPLMPLCRVGAEAVMDFAVRPVIDSNRPPLLSGPRPDYEAPSGEDILGLGVLPTLDEADKAKLRWALDGDASSPYPDEEGGGVKGAAATAATPAEDAAFLKSLQDYALRIEAQKARAAAGGSAEATAAAAPVDSDYDRIVAAAVDAASGGRLSRAKAAIEAPAAPAAGSFSRSPGQQPLK